MADQATLRASAPTLRVRSAAAGRRRLLVQTCVALATGNVVAQAVRAVRDLGNTDFVYAFMTAARMLHSGTSALYSHDAQQAARAQFIQLVPTGANDRYTNPPLAAWLIQPIALLPPETALLVFLAISGAAALAGAAVLATRVLDGRPRDVAVLTTALCVATLPGAQAFAVVNWDALLLLPLALATWAAVRERPLLAGALTAALLVKPQTVWLLPLALLLAGSWRALAGFAAGAGVWAVSTLALIGPGQVAGWVGDNLPAHTLEAHLTLGLPGAAAALFGGGAAFVATAVLLVCAAAAGWRLRRLLANDLAATLALALVASALTAPHIWPEDLLLVGVGLTVWARVDLRAALTAAVALDIAYLLDGALPSPLGHLEAAVLLAVTVAMARSLGRTPTALTPERGRRPAPLRAGAAGAA